MLRRLARLLRAVLSQCLRTSSDSSWALSFGSKTSRRTNPDPSTGFHCGSHLQNGFALDSPAISFEMSLCRTLLDVTFKVRRSLARDCSTHVDDGILFCAKTVALHM